MKFTVSFEAISNLFQLIEALFEDWFIFVVFPLCVIFTVPLLTTPPIGAATLSVEHPIRVLSTKDMFLFLRIINFELKLFLCLTMSIPLLNNCSYFIFFNIIKPYNCIF